MWKAQLAPGQSVTSGVSRNANGSTIVMQSHNNGTAEGTGKTYMAFWYVPAVGRWVKSVEEFYDANGCAMRATRTNWCRSSAPAWTAAHRWPASLCPRPPGGRAAGHLAYRRPVTARAHLRIERRLRQLARQREPADIPQPVVERIVQRMRARIPPEAVEAERRGCRACAAGVEQRLAVLERARCATIFASDTASATSARSSAVSASCRAHARCNAAAARSASRRSPAHACRRSAAAVRIVARLRDLRLNPRAAMLQHVVARFRQRAFRGSTNRLVSTSCDTSVRSVARGSAASRNGAAPRPPRASRRRSARCRCRSGAGRSDPSLRDRDPRAIGRHHAEHGAAGVRIVRGHRHALRAARARTEALHAIEPVAAVRRGYHEPRVERIDRIAPPPLLLDRATQARCAALPHTSTLTTCRHWNPTRCASALSTRAICRIAS